MKKIVAFLLVLILSLVSLSHVNANEIKTREIYDGYKTWTISLNQPVKVVSVTEKTVYIVDTTTNKKIPVEYFFNSSKTKIIVAPLEEYKDNIPYTLVVKDIKSRFGNKTLKTNWESQFVYHSIALVSIE